VRGAISDDRPYRDCVAFVVFYATNVRNASPSIGGLRTDSILNLLNHRRFHLRWLDRHSPLSFSTAPAQLASAPRH
jgi:hypothetical protein